MANWLSKYEQGGLVLKKKTKDNYGKKANPNNVQASVGPDFVGLGYNIKGRNYSPAWGGQFQNGGNVAQEGKEVTYVHQPARRYEGLTDVGPGEQYMLKRTVTPYKSKRDIRKYTEAPTDPRQVNFLSNYAGATGEPLNKDFVYPTKVPYEGERHWNIDRFIIDPQFKNSEKLNTTESTKGEMKKTVLADMYKYFMLQNKGDKDESWKQAKRFVRQEINPRVNGAVYDEYLRKELPIPNIMGITSLVDDSYLQKYENVKSRALSETTQDGYAKLMQENPLSRRKATKVGMDWLMNYKGLSRKEAKETLKKTKESPKYESSNDKPLIDMSSEEAYFKNMRGDNPPNYAMGGGIPGAVGFTYARTINPAPSNGKYAKKTKASAQNGQEMKFYQEGLDFTPKTISQNGSVIKDDMGQWAHPGEITEIGSNEITMQGVDYPVLGISDTGDAQMMYPDQDYKFDGEKVIEYPMMKGGGWLNKYK